MDPENMDAMDAAMEPEAAPVEANPTAENNAEEDKPLLDDDTVDS